MCGVAEYCVPERYMDAFEAFSDHDVCYVVYDDAVTIKGMLWFDAVNRYALHIMQYKIAPSVNRC